MSAIERITITVPAEMAATVRAAVDSGSYATTSEIVREALREWTRRQDVHAQALASLREAIAEGDKGDGIAADEVMAELRAIIAERRATAQ